MIKEEHDCEYIEIAFRMKMSDYKALPCKETEKMWKESPYNISSLNIVGQIIVLGSDGFISHKCELDG